MAVKTARTGRKNTIKGGKGMNRKMMMEALEKKYPDVGKIIKRVKMALGISELDKAMIEGQMISLCGSLNEADEYELHIGEWPAAGTYSDVRESVACGQTVRNETIFTIVRRTGKPRSWDVYIDLPKTYFRK